MRKMFCTLGVGVWALCSQVMADAQSLLAKVPETYDYAICIDTKQLDAGAFMVLDMLKGAKAPEAQNQNSANPPSNMGVMIESGKAYINTMKAVAAIYGINPETTPFIVSALKGIKGNENATSVKGIVLIETSVPEQKMIEYLKSLKGYFGEISEEETVGDHKVYKVNSKNTDKNSPKMEVKYFTFLDDKTLVLASDKDCLTEMKTLKGKPAHFLHQDDVSRNPMIWFGSNENSDLSTKYYKKHVSNETPSQGRPGYKNFYGFVSLDQANSKITSEYNIVATNSECAMKMESMFQLYSGMLTMTSQNPALIKDSFQITNRACKLFGKVKIDKEVCVLLAETYNKILKGQTIMVGTEGAKEVKETPASEKKGLTIKREE